jgi:Zinc finger, C3HC4 type (RING finger)
MPSTEQNDPRDEIIKSLTTALALMSQTKPKNEIVNTETHEMGTDTERDSSIWEMCPICMSDEHGTGHPPGGRVIMNCGHSICVDCYVEISQQSGDCKCPMCRAPMPRLIHPPQPQPLRLRLRRAGEIVVNEPAPAWLTNPQTPEEATVARRIQIRTPAPAPTPAPAQTTTTTTHVRYTDTFPHSIVTTTTESVPAPHAPVVVNMARALAMEDEYNEQQAALAPVPVPEPEEENEPLLTIDNHGHVRYHMYRTAALATEHGVRHTARCQECRWFGPTMTGGGQRDNPNCVTRRDIQGGGRQNMCLICSYSVNWDRIWEQGSNAGQTPNPTIVWYSRR